MDDLTRQRFDRIDQRLTDMPKVIATAFVEAFANARTALTRDIEAHYAAAEQAADRRHGEFLREADRRHGELLAALTAMVGAVSDLKGRLGSKS